MEHTVYKEGSFLCSCEKMHANPIKEIVIGAGALEKLKTAPSELHLGRKAMLITDAFVYDLMGKEIEDYLRQACCQVKALAYPLPMVPDEEHLFDFLECYEPDVDFFVAAGTGAVNDITRYFSGKFAKPYISVPTAPSMDGYSAKVSLLFVKGVKQTLDAVAPMAIYADTNYLKGVPSRLLAAGIGDLAAKITACADWKISSLVNGEYYCQHTIDDLMKIVDKCLAMPSALTNRDQDTVQHLTDGLMFSGVAMHWVGSSRPAAGAEHHITHFWGMQSGNPQHLHGIEVAVGTLIMLDTYRKVLELDFQKVDADAWAAQMPDKEAWEAQVREIYGDQAGVAFKQQKDKTFDKAQIAQRIRNIQANEEPIKEIIRQTLKQGEHLEQAMKELGAPTTYRELGISDEMFRTSHFWAKEIRPKYTVLDLAYDLGALEEIGEALSQK